MRKTAKYKKNVFSWLSKSYEQVKKENVDKRKKKNKKYVLLLTVSAV